MLALIAEAAGHPAWRDPAWVTSVAAVLSALGGWGGAVIAGRKTQKQTQKEIAATREAVTNNHGTHIREDIDRVITHQSDIMRRIDTLAAKIDLAEVERSDQGAASAHRFTRLERAIDGLLADVRSSHQEHARLHARIDKKEDRPGTGPDEDGQAA